MARLTRRAVAGAGGSFRQRHPVGLRASGGPLLRWTKGPRGYRQARAARLRAARRRGRRREAPPNWRGRGGRRKAASDLRRRMEILDPFSFHDLTKTRRWHVVERDEAPVEGGRSTETAPQCDLLH